MGKCVCDVSVRVCSDGKHSCNQGLVKSSGLQTFTHFNEP